MDIITTKPQGRLLFSQRLYSFVNDHFSVMSIIFFEFFGTLFFSYGVVTGLNGNFTYSPMFEGTFSSVWIPLCLFLMICWAARFTNGHFNPAVTLAFMLKKQGRVPFTKGLIYWTSQLLGAISGTGIAYWVNDTSKAGAPWVATVNDYKYILDAFRGQVFGTFLLVFFIMTVSTGDTSPCGSVVEGNAFVPMMLLCARQYSYRLQGLNPGFAISFQLFYCIRYGNWQVWQYVWSDFFGPFIGSILAVCFFQYVYRRFLLYYLKKPKILTRISLQEAELF